MTKKKLFRLKRFVVAISVLLILFFGLIILFVDFRKIPSPNTYIITLTSEGFEPKNLTVNINDFVRFENRTISEFWPASDLHPSHNLYPEFDPKEPIGQGKSWTFQLKKPGIHPYHDHLKEGTTGVITVLDKNGNIKEVDCNNQKEKSACWNNQLVETMKKEGIAQGFTLFEKLQRTYPDFRNDCHSYTHLLGTTAYTIFFKEHKPIPTSPVTSSCGYGFYHGFMDVLGQETSDIGKIRAFCDSLKDKGRLNEKGQNYLQCYHGIGHGAVDRHDNKRITDIQPIINQSLSICESVNKNDLEMSYCSQGVFGPSYAIYENESTESKKLIKQFGILSLCLQQQERYKDWCYHALSKFLLVTNNNSFPKAMTFINRITVEKYKQIAVYESAQSFMRLHSQPEEYKTDISTCNALDTQYHNGCILGLVDGILLNGNTKNNIVPATTFCKSKYLNSPDQKLCQEKVAESIKNTY